MLMFLAKWTICCVRYSLVDSQGGGFKLDFRTTFCGYLLVSASGKVFSRASAREIKNTIFWRVTLSRL